MSKLPYDAVAAAMCRAAVRHQADRAGAFERHQVDWPGNACAIDVQGHLGVQDAERVAVERRSGRTGAVLTESWSTPMRCGGARAGQPPRRR